MPTILSQDYPEFELVIVNDCSQDETSAYLKRLLIEHPEVNVVTLSQSLNFFKGKKFPLSMGIKSAKYDLLLLTDADCKPNNDQWIKGMMSAYNNDKIEIVVGYGPYAKRKGLLNKLIRFDTLYTAIQYLSMALAKKPIWEWEETFLTEGLLSIKTKALPLIIQYRQAMTTCS